MLVSVQLRIFQLTVHYIVTLYYSHMNESVRLQIGPLHYKQFRLLFFQHLSPHFLYLI